MKKASILFLLLPTLLWAGPETDPALKTPLEAFRKGFRKAYYDYKKEGFGSFQCEVTSAPKKNKHQDKSLEKDLLFYAIRSLMEFDFKLGYDGKKVKVDEFRWKTLEKGLDKKEREDFAKALQPLLQAQMDLWSTFTLPESRTDGKNEVQVTKLLRTKTGWEMHLKGGGDHCVFYFEPDYRLDHGVIQMKGGKKPLTFTLDHERTPKGFLVRSCTFSAEEKLFFRSRIDYLPTDGFPLPSRIELSFSQKGPESFDLSDVLTFSRYKVVR